MASSVTLNPTVYSFNKDPMYFELESGLFTGAEPPYEPSEDNLSLYLEVWFAFSDEADFSRLLVLNTAYSRWNKKTQFDASYLAPLYITPPTASSITAYEAGTAPKHSGRIQIRHNDMFGAPAEVPETVETFGPFYVIQGSSMYWQGFGDAATLNNILHSFLNRNGRLLAREVRKEQPEYIYFYNSAAASITVEIAFFYTDGTFDNVTRGPFTCEEEMVNWVSVGWNQLELDDDVDTEKTLSYYYITLSTIVGGIAYKLDDHTTEYDHYFLFDNGLGGLDTLRCSGKTIFGASGSRQLFDKARFRGTDFQTGLVGVHNATASEEWQMNTGYYHEDWCRHLAQLLTGDIWYIDRARGKFLKCTITNNSLRLVDKEDDPTLQSVEFTVKFHETPSINSYLL